MQGDRAAWWPAPLVSGTLSLPVVKAQPRVKAAERISAARSRETTGMDLQAAQSAFESAFDAEKHGREGLKVMAETGSTFHVSVRFKDVDAERGFDVVAEPLPSEDRSAGQLGQAVAEVVQRELMYGQLPAQDENGDFRRIVV